MKKKNSNPKELYDLYNKSHSLAQSLTYLSKKPDIKKALPIYEELVINGYSPACFDLGYMYLVGFLVEKNLKSANFYFEIGFDLEHYFSSIQYSINKRQGRGCEIDLFMTDYIVQKSNQYHFNSYDNPLYETIKNVLLKAIEYGDLDAINTYAYIHEYGIGTPENYKIAIKYYNMGLEKGYDFSMINLANCYENGKGVTVDVLKAKELFEMAAEKNNIYAINQLAKYYYKKKKDVIKVLEKGVKLNSANSMLELAKIYDSTDDKLAREYIFKASLSMKIDLKNYPKYRDDKEIVINCIKLNPKNLLYASKTLNDDKDVVIEAILLDKNMLEHASTRLQTSLEILMILDGKYLKLLPDNERISKLNDINFYFF